MSTGQRLTYGDDPSQWADLNRPADTTPLPEAHPDGSPSVPGPIPA